MKRFLGTLKSRKNDLLDGIRELDIIVEGGPLSEAERLRKEEMSRGLERFILLK